MPTSCAAALRGRLETELEAIAGPILKALPVEAYLALFKALPAQARYSLIPAEAGRICEAVGSAGGDEAVELYNRIATLHLLERGTALRAHATLTPEVRRLLEAALARIGKEAERGRRGFHRLSNAAFVKDFAICRGRLLPCGVEWVDPRAGVPRRLLAGRGTAQALLGLWRIVSRGGGLRPYCEMHYDSRMIGLFNAAGYTELYLRLADLLEVNRHILGVTSASWWHDEALQEISPELSFVDAHPRAAGAMFFDAGTHPTATADALRFSPERKALHAEGRYTPRVFMMVWLRRDLLAWARRYRG